MGEEAEEAALGPEGQHMGGLLGSPSPHTSQLATEAAAPGEWRTAAVRPLSPARGLRQGGRASQETTPLLAEAQWGAWAPPSGLSWGALTSSLEAEAPRLGAERPPCRWAAVLS